MLASAELTVLASAELTVLASAELTANSVPGGRQCSVSIYQTDVYSGLQQKSSHHPQTNRVKSELSNRIRRWYDIVTLLQSQRWL